jgi:hypothetical protein
MLGLFERELSIVELRGKLVFSFISIIGSLVCAP